MEALAGVGSGMAVVSLSIQLVQSVDKIRTLIRNVKGAPAELRRLAELLTRLAAVLQDVQNLLERQSSLHTLVQHFPTASPAIMVCLQSCENTLRPLEELLRKSQKTHDGSTITQLRNDIRIGLKAKDIAALEMRIQHEINYLHTALGTNTSTILVNILPELLKNQQNNALTHSREPRLLAITQSSDDSSVLCEPEVHPDPSEPRFFRRTTEIESPLRRFGVRQRKTIRYIRFPGNQQSRKLLHRCQEIISEENEYIISWELLGQGIRWSRERPCNRILPSLSVYPVVEEFSFDLYMTLCSSSLQSIQKMFASGALHPFTRDRQVDSSLLHIAALSGRADIYRLLLEYGVKPDLTTYGLYPLQFAMIQPGKNGVDIYRSCIADLVHIENFSYDNWFETVCYNGDVNGMWWLWQQSQHFLCDQELFDFQIILIRSVLKYIAREQSEEKREAAFQTWAKLIKKELLDEIESGHCQLLRSFWSWGVDQQSMNSYNEGSALIGLLSRLGVDFRTCIIRELETLRDGIVEAQSGKTPDMKIMFGQNEGGDWTLGWEWTYELYEPQTPVYTVLSQYEVIATTFGWLKWPFSKSEYGPYRVMMSAEPMRDSRFQRRMATKARKERARAGTKRPRSKIPGSWVF